MASPSCPNPTWEAGDSNCKATAGLTELLWGWWPPHVKARSWALFLTGNPSPRVRAHKGRGEGKWETTSFIEVTCSFKTLTHGEFPVHAGSTVKPQDHKNTKPLKCTNFWKVTYWKSGYCGQPLRRELGAASHSLALLFPPPGYLFMAIMQQDRGQMSLYSPFRCAHHSINRDTCTEQKSFQSWPSAELPVANLQTTHGQGSFNQVQVGLHRAPDLKLLHLSLIYPDHKKKVSALITCQVAQPCT